jgi:hypothetical protein
VVHGKHKTIKSLIKETDELKRLMGCMHSIFYPLSEIERDVFSIGRGPV